MIPVGTEPSSSSPSSWHGAVTPTRMRRDVVSAPWRILPAWLVLFALPGYQLFTAASWGGFISAAALIGVWFVFDIGVGLPRAAGIPTWTRWMCLTAFAAVMLARTAKGNLVVTASGTQWITPALLALALAGIAWDVRAGVRRCTPPLHWPLPAGRWLVCEGTNRWLNHHWRVPRQRAALDLVKLTPAGRSFRGWQPHTIDSFASTGAVVTSPDRWHGHRCSRRLPVVADRRCPRYGQPRHCRRRPLPRVAGPLPAGVGRCAGGRRGDSRRTPRPRGDIGELVSAAPAHPRH